MPHKSAALAKTLWIVPSEFSKVDTSLLLYEALLLMSQFPTVQWSSFEVEIKSAYYNPKYHGQNQLKLY